MTTTPTTIDTITDDQIATLYTEAANAGDLGMCHICDVARLGLGATDAEIHRCRAEVVRVIRDAEAQAD